MTDSIEEIAARCTSTPSERGDVRFELAFSGRTGCLLGDGAGYRVPAEKRLVIEQISGLLSDGAPTSNQYRLGIGAGATRMTRWLRAQQPLTVIGTRYRLTALAVRFFAEPGTFVVLDVARTCPVGEWSCILTVRGFLMAV